MIARALRTLRDIYLLSLLFAIWTGLCLMADAAAMNLAIVAVFRARGILP